MWPLYKLADSVVYNDNILWPGPGPGICPSPIPGPSPRLILGPGPSPSPGSDPSTGPGSSHLLEKAVIDNS